LQDFFSNNQEALWAFLRPKRLLRGFSNLIVAVVYHPDQHPNTSDAALNRYLTSSLNKNRRRIPEEWDFDSWRFETIRLQGISQMLPARTNHQDPDTG